MTYVRLGTDDPSTSPTVPADGSDFARLGGERGLRAIIDDFMTRVFADVMIGFLFAAAPKARIREMEFRYAAAHLGGPTAYDGRPLDEAHRASPISSGHFARRRQLLDETLSAHAVPDDIRQRWLAHVDAQRALVLASHVDACGPAGGR